MNLFLRFNLIFNFVVFLTTSTLARELSEPAAKRIEKSALECDKIKAGSCSFTGYQYFSEFLRSAYKNYDDVEKLKKAIHYQKLACKHDSKYCKEVDNYERWLKKIENPNYSTCQLARTGYKANGKQSFTGFSTVILKENKSDKIDPYDSFVTREECEKLCDVAIQKMKSKSDSKTIIASCRFGHKNIGKMVEKKF